MGGCAVFHDAAPSRGLRLGGERIADSVTNEAKRPSLAREPIRTVAEKLAILLKGLAERPHDP